MEVREAGVADTHHAQVKKSGNGAHVLVPKAWIGRRVLVLLKEETNG